MLQLYFTSLNFDWVTVPIEPLLDLSNVRYRVPDYVSGSNFNFSQKMLTHHYCGQSFMEGGLMSMGIIRKPRRDLLSFHFRVTNDTGTVEVVEFRSRFWERETKIRSKHIRSEIVIILCLILYLLKWSTLTIPWLLTVTKKE